MKLYVAGSSKERARFREAVRGLDLTFDWERGFQLYEKALRDSDNATAEHLAGNARLSCITGVARADAFVLLIPETPSRGAWFEAGIAWSELSLPTYSVGDASRLDIWGPCFDQHFDTMDACLAHLGIERSCG